MCLGESSLSQGLGTELRKHALGSIPHRANLMELSKDLPENETLLSVP